MIGVMMILGGFAVIYVIAVKLGNYDSDSAEESMDSNDSENLLFSASEEHDSEMTTVENTVEMKFNMWLGIFSSLCSWFLALNCFVADEDDIGIVFFLWGDEHCGHIFCGSRDYSIDQTF